MSQEPFAELQALGNTYALFKEPLSHNGFWNHVMTLNINLSHYKIMKAFLKHEDDTEIARKNILNIIRHRVKEIFIELLHDNNEESYSDFITILITIEIIWDNRDGKVLLTDLTANPMISKEKIQRDFSDPIYNLMSDLSE